MSNAFFFNPAWDVTKYPVFNTVAQETAKYQGSVYVSLTPYCKWEFDMTMPYVPGSLNDPTSDLALLVGLMISCRGRAGTFTYTDPLDNHVSKAQFGTGDGVTT